MILVAVVFVLVAAVALILGTFVDAGTAYVWISIGACVATFGALTASSWMRRREPEPVEEAPSPAADAGSARRVVRRVTPAGGTRTVVRRDAASGDTRKMSGDTRKMSGDTRTVSGGTRKVVRRVGGEGQQQAAAAADRSGTRGERARAVLSEIKGVGPTKQDALLKEFGSLEKLAQADIDELTAVRGVGESVAAAIKQALQDR